MAIAVALLNPALTAVLTSVLFDSFVNAKVLFEAADTSELLVTVRNFTGPDLVHSACSVILLVLEKVVFSFDGFEASVARLGWLLDLLTVNADDFGDRVRPLVASLMARAWRHLFSVNTV